MTPDEARECFSNDVSPAVFSAELGEDLHVRVYPMTDQKGYLWAIWDGFDWDNPCESIKAGAVVEGNMHDVVTVAVSQLLAYKGRSR